MSSTGPFRTAVATLASTVAATLVLAGCGVGEAVGETTQRVETDSVPAAGIVAMDVDTENGMVEVRSGDVTEITIETTYDEPDRGDGDSDVDVDNGRLSVTGQCDQSWYQRCSVGYRITLPADIDVTISTDGGRIDLSGTTGDVDVYSDDGTIEATAIGSDRVSARTDNGRVELEFLVTPTDVVARSDNGKVSVTVPDGDAVYAVDAASDDGDVDVDVRTDPGAPNTIEAYSDNGSVTVTQR